MAIFPLFLRHKTNLTSARGEGLLGKRKGEGLGEFNGVCVVLRGE
jgi:hypothetical protein